MSKFSDRYKYGRINEKLLTKGDFMSYTIDYFEEKKVMGYLIAFYRKHMQVNKNENKLTNFLRIDKEGCLQCVFNDSCHQEKKKYVLLQLYIKLKEEYQQTVSVSIISCHIN